MRKWIEDFPCVRLNLFPDTSGDWLVWAILSGYGTVLWRQDTNPGARAAMIAWTLSGGPLVNGKLPPKACLFWACVNLTDLGRRLAKELSETSTIPPPKFFELMQHTPAAHSEKPVQHTLNFAAH